MYIVDSQVHIWAANTPERPWPPGRHQPHRAVPFQKQDLIREMDAAGVHRAIIVPPSWEGDRNDLGLDAARSHPERLAVMGRFDTEAPGASMARHWARRAVTVLIVTDPSRSSRSPSCRITLVWKWLALPCHGSCSPAT